MTVNSPTVIEGEDDFIPVKKTAMDTITGGGKDIQVDLLTNKIKSQYKKLPRAIGRDFEVLGLLGAGDVGRVYLVKKSNKQLLLPEARNEEIFALKVMSQFDLNKRNKQRRFKAEYEILLASKHPFVMTLHTAFADERNYYLLTEFCAGGDLAGLMKKQSGKHFTEQQALQYSSEVLSALEYLHFNGIIYRDLKTENVLVHQDGHLRLTDFDLSKRVRTERTLSSFQPVSDKGKSLVNIFPTALSESSNSFVGTAEYLSPEVIRGEHSQAADFWTLGIFIYELLYGVTPFYAQGGFSQIQRKIQAGIFTFPTNIKTSDLVKDLIMKLLKANPQERLGTKYGASELKQHSWFKHVNFAMLYSPPIRIEPKTVFEYFRAIPREAEQIAKDFAGTGFQLPKKAEALVGQALKLLENAGLPTHPKPIDLNEEDKKDIVQQQQEEQGMQTIQVTAGAKKRAGLNDLFGGAKKKEAPQGQEVADVSIVKVDPRRSLAGAKAIDDF